MIINSIKIIQSIANIATSLNDDIMGTCETLLTLVPRYELLIHYNVCAHNFMLIILMFLVYRILNQIMWLIQKSYLKY